MNIIEAIKSGKRFKRIGRALFGSVQPYYSLEEILASDWELEEEKAEVTKNQIFEVLSLYAEEKIGIREALRHLGFKEV